MDKFLWTILFFCCLNTVGIFHLMWKLTKVEAELEHDHLSPFQRFCKTLWDEANKPKDNK